MRFTKERLKKPFILKTVTFLSLLIIVLGIAYYYGYFKKNCYQDRSCFDDAFKNCKPSKLISVVDNNYYYYAIDGKRGGDCRVRIQLMKMGVGTSEELINSLEGKSMKCNIPLSKTNSVSFDTMPDVLNYCSGPLKEAIYEQIIAKMYSLIISNLGPIVKEAKEFYKV